MKQKLRSLFLLSCLTLASALSYAAEPIPSVFLNNVDESYLPAVKKAFINREWAITATSDSMVKGELNHRKIEARLSIYLKGDQLLYLCDCQKYRSVGTSSAMSSLMEEKKVDYVPKGWIGNLKKDTLRFVKMAKINQ